jgi:NAD-dependent dihydropyrimidine dehydrogenase PreA subunit
MFSLKFLAKNCIACGICMDVCDAKAIAMHTTWPRSPEGKVLTYCLLRSREQDQPSTAQMMTFPYLARPVVCNGCEKCVNQCPVNSIVLESKGSAQERVGDDCLPKNVPDPKSIDLGTKALPTRSRSAIIGPK